MAFIKDRTVMIPTPGGRGRFDTSPEVQMEVSSSIISVEEVSQLSSGLNVLENSAFEILSLLPSIRTQTTELSADLLRMKLIAMVESFEKSAYEANLDSKEVEIARYILCATVDELVMNTPLGEEAQWSRHCLLSHYHGETWGGENVFVILGNLNKNPHKNIDLLELIYICMSLGFEGKYAVEPDRLSQLYELKKSLYHTLTQIRGTTPKALSPHWKGEDTLAKTLRSYLPLWVAAVFLVAMACMVYFYLLIHINDQSSIALRSASRVLTEQHSQFKVQLPQVNESVFIRVSRLFAPEIEKNQIRLSDRSQQIRIVINSDLLFRSGSAELEPEYAALISYMGRELMSEQGRILVEGHTDSIPINTIRFPSNWHLSQARAEQVKRLLEQAGKEYGRYQIEARADTQPLANNATPEGRAQNRRVELVLLPETDWR
ncbi:type VI secretion system protein TssL [Nitrincola tibetensis]|uniref:Type VI secretion system protein TssL n=1 Tax=Nitrincola tibetensis TaxID=2219697 RepID=A0A364NQ70_9GAMM|nr:type VI secretion system protein TssL, long form [Nitrincola tibetensis]RAU19035.1 type VI secretion system protein TssL [Nitrincola tibetensis]